MHLLQHSIHYSYYLFLLKKKLEISQVQVISQEINFSRIQNLFISTLFQSIPFHSLLNNVYEDNKEHTKQILSFHFKAKIYLLQTLFNIQFNYHLLWNYGGIHFLSPQGGHIVNFQVFYIIFLKSSSNRDFTCFRLFYLLNKVQKHLFTCL